MRYECGKEPQFQCPHCQYKAKRKSTLKTHIILRHSTLLHSCNDCQKSYQHYKSLLRHRNYECGKQPRFQCPHCSHKSKQKSALKSHIAKTNSTMAGFSCDRCQRKYLHKVSLYNHQKYECGKQPQFACPYCPYRAKRKGTLKEHIFNSKEAIFKCPNCPKFYKHSPSLMKHLKYECGVEPKFKCPQCPYRAKQKITLKKHMINIHMNVGRFVCGMCNNSYKYKQGLIQHQRYECGKPAKFQCPYCSYKAKLSGTLKAHVAVKHTDRFSCGKCGASYKHKKGLAQHLKYFCGKPPQQLCPHCPYRTKLKSNLKAHIISKHVFYFLERFVCNACGSSYKYKQGLAQHLKFFCGKPPQLQCPYCDYKAKFKSNLKGHIASKHIKRRHLCPQCHRSYKYKRGLNQHLKFECGKDPQQFCPYCPFKTKHRNTLNKHIVIRHLDAASRRFLCKQCNKSYKYRQGLRTHQKFECGKEPQMLCPLCPYRAKQKVALKRHVVIVRIGNKHQCPDCFRSYKQKGHMIAHRKYECGKEPQFQCPLCSYRSKQKSQLKRHISLKHWGPANKHQCPDCFRSYKHKGHMMAHRKYECGKEPRFLCPHCTFRTKTRSNLMSHIACKHTFQKFSNFS
ncbi:hypothetical protein O3M35_011202 [Rhynocoris fuscipes]|uniref:C2H2-type domain-containing protein n=1 Tax=Rhynocoris fuscipes TaxID=488301 RepID=A0AAW1CXZ9_9HEMI